MANEQENREIQPEYQVLIEGPLQLSELVDTYIREDQGVHMFLNRIMHKLYTKNQEFVIKSELYLQINKRMTIKCFKEL